MRRRVVIRTEERVAVHYELELAGEGPGGAREFAQLQNASLHGACVLTQFAHAPEERVWLRSRSGQVLARARVVYSHWRKGRYATGMELLLTDSEWNRLWAAAGIGHTTSVSSRQRKGPLASAE